MRRKDESAPRPRGKGRPPKSGAPDARALLIASARELLRARRPEDINRLEIARHAGVDPALVRYYFGDKQGLLEATAAGMLEELRRERGFVQNKQTTIREKLSAQVRFLVDVLHAYPFLHDLLTSQIERAQREGIAEVRESLIAEPFGAFRALIADAIDAGEMRPTNIVFLYVAIIGLCSFPMRTRALLEQLLDVDGTTARLAADYADFVTALLLDGLTQGQADAPHRHRQPRPPLPA